MTKKQQVTMFTHIAVGSAPSECSFQSTTEINIYITDILLYSTVEYYLNHPSSWLS